MTNGFHCEPQRGARPNVGMLAAAIGRWSEYTQRLPPPMKSRPAVIEVVVGEVVDRDALRRQAVPTVQLVRE